MQLKQTGHCRVIVSHPVAFWSQKELSKFVEIICKRNLNWFQKYPNLHGTSYIFGRRVHNVNAENIFKLTGVYEYAIVTSLHMTT